MPAEEQRITNAKYIRYNIKDNLRHMLHMTSILERQSASKARQLKTQRPHSAKPKSTSPPHIRTGLEGKPPKPLYQFPSLSLSGLRSVQRTGGHSTEPAKFEERKVKSAAHSSDRVLAFSERFGQIVKQGRGSSKGGKENSQRENVVSFIPGMTESGRSPGVIIRQEKAKHSHSPPKDSTQFTIRDYKYSHLDVLLEKKVKAGVKEPFDRFVMQILARGKPEFDKICQQIQGTAIYANAMKELNNTLIKQRQSAHVFGAETLFSPILVHSLTKKLDDARWYQLYLIKILYKKPLINKIK